MTDLPEIRYARSGDVRGIAAYIGARVSALAAPSEVPISSTVKDLVAGTSLVFDDASEHELKDAPTAGSSSG
jgi:class 3 adenylate cyclase